MNLTALSRPSPVQALPEGCSRTPSLDLFAAAEPTVPSHVTPGLTVLVIEVHTLPVRRGGAEQDVGVKERLEDFVRPDEVADDLVLLLRGGVGEDDVARLQRQARDLDRRFSWRAGPCFGASVFAATPESEGLVLATRMDVRRRYYRIAYRDIAGQLLVLPTFRRPHWTVMFNGPDGPDYRVFVDAYGELRDNPYWTRKPGRRPR